MLHDAGLIREEREGGWTYYRVDAAGFTDGIQELWPALAKQLRSLEGARQDDARLQEVLRQRKEDFRDPESRGICPGRSWAAWSRTLSYLVPPSTVADLGCGEGYLTMELARSARKVIAVDASRAMLDRAKSLAKRHKVKNVYWKHSAIEHLSIPDASVEVAMMAQVLHCLEKPSAGLKEAHRILKPGGRLLLQELRTHKEEWVREKLGDVHLGFDEKELITLLEDASFIDIQIEIGSKRRGDPIVVLIGSARKKK